MKIAIVVAAILVAAWASVLAIRPDLVRPALAVKSDIYGFAPSMTLGEANKLIAQRKYRCRQVQDSPVVDCNIDGARVSIAFDGAGEKGLIQRITAELGSDRNPEATVRALSEQYNAQASKGPNGNWVWPIGARFKLSYDGATVMLFDEQASNARRP
ncbi:hypothetical protein ES707_12477 [subsurface metagenome]